MQQLRVAFAPGVTPDKWARAWRERHPRLPLRLLPLEQDAPRAVLDDGTADMLLGRLPVDLDSPSPLHCVRLYDEVPVVVASSEHFLAAADADTPIDLAELDGEQLVLPHPSGWTPKVEQLDFPPMSVKDAIEVAAAGTGVVIVPMSLARLYHRKDVVQRPVDLPPTTVALLWRRDADSDVHQDFVGVVRGRRPRSSR
ncbi:LysR family transcriptional regulator substrate-binding protein [Nocardioides sp. zg-536]|uniref:LysR family transcriptional regulator substrate-binding protein n=1 Tax=Nocardioides faecalis TaxID=2803858 RepID=A0A938Y872_9ACTN|nr:LysR family transcriptional regulator substrate-binding protein [Nocardioides faecalis]MBM9459019.1 LysR family transcriptional regulator substrate-binding protein [Nocardioides faecalis]QVI57286.1 LysR family transcriptional regulator substrate-binding protein [Nocardioides faecalis]